MSDGTAENTDKTWWTREHPFAELHTTESGGIGINCGGYVYVKTAEEWHKLAGGKFGHLSPDSDNPFNPPCPRCAQLEAKLALAVEALKEISKGSCDGRWDGACGGADSLAREAEETLDKLKGNNAD